ncbi:MAG TPA: PQQ-binding-like beta-propeller repeat protein [Pirellulales bacterium]|nr:PQQ-binding-like beta-propeller repeat protein [Pirellulales bacterium]
MTTNRARSFALLAGPALLVLAALDAQADEVDYFRHGGGVAADDERPLVEKLEDEQLLWRVPMPPGHSTPCVRGDAIYVTTFENDELTTLALDRRSGRTMWRQVAPAERIELFHETSSPAAATPACDGQRVYVFFGSYGLLCYDLKGGLVWAKPMGPFQDEFGAGSSPVLVDGKLIISGDHDIDSFVMAVDCMTGDTLWKTDRDGFTRSYATPVVWVADGQKQIVVAGALQLVAYGADDGSKLWWVNGLARIVNTTPAQSQGLLYVATWSPGGDSDARLAMDPWSDAVAKWDKDGDGKLVREEVPDAEVLDRFFRIDLNQDKGLDETEWNKYARVFELAQNTLMAIRPRGTGDLTGSGVVWEYNKGLPYVPSPLVYQDRLYMVKNGGILTCLEAARGRMLKQVRLAGNDNYYSSPVAGDGKLYLASEHGVVSVLRAGAKCELISSRDFQERTVATPVIADRKIYLRTEKALYCFGSR